MVRLFHKFSPVLIKALSLGIFHLGFGTAINEWSNFSSWNGFQTSTKNEEISFLVCYEHKKKSSTCSITVHVLTKLPFYHVCKKAAFLQLHNCKYYDF